MDKKFGQEHISPQEKSANQIYEELDKAHDEFIESTEKAHELHMKAGENGLSKEEFDAIINECEELDAQSNEKFEIMKQLHEQWMKLMDEEMKRLESERIEGK